MVINSLVPLVTIMVSLFTLLAFLGVIAVMEVLNQRNKKVILAAGILIGSLLVTVINWTVR